MIGVHFNKSIAEEFLDAIRNGKPIRPPGGEWSGNQMLALAGMLYAGVFSQGPHNFQVAGIDYERFQDEAHLERREAVEETFNSDIHNAIDFVSMLTFKVIDGQYDEDCKEEVKAVLFGEHEVAPVQGFKDAPGPLDR